MLEFRGKVRQQKIPLAARPQVATKSSQSKTVAEGDLFQNILQSSLYDPSQNESVTPADAYLSRVALKKLLSNPRLPGFGHPIPRADMQPAENVDRMLLVSAFTLT